MPVTDIYIISILKTLESPLDCEEIKHKGNQPCIFIGRTATTPEVLILWPPDAKSQLIGKNPAAAAAAKSLQLCPTLCDPTDGSPPGSPVSGILHLNCIQA